MGENICVEYKKYIFCTNIMSWTLFIWFGVGTSEWLFSETFLSENAGNLLAIYCIYWRHVNFIRRITLHGVTRVHLYNEYAKERPFWLTCRIMSRSQVPT